MNASARELKGLEKELKRRDRALFLREANLEDREKEVAAREQNVAVVEERLGQQLRAPMQSEPAGRPKRELGRHEQCWCKSGKKYKNCHLASDQSR